MTTTAKPRLRWSSARVCARRAVYEGTAAPARERTDREARILFRGTRIGQDYADWLERQHPGKVHREVEVEWGWGTGHIDIQLDGPEGPVAIEVLSSKWATDHTIRAKLRQLVGYMEISVRGYVQGVLVILDPGDFSEDRIIVNPSSDLYAALAAEAGQVLAAIKRWDDTGELPARVCAKPDQGEAYMCVHAGHCFDGWEPEPAATIDRPEVVSWAGRWAAAKQLEREAAAVVKRLEDERKAIEAEADELDIPVGESHAGPWAIKRTHVARRPTLDTRKVEAAGIPIPDHCWKPGATYTRWTVERADETGPVDYGTVPF